MRSKLQELANFAYGCVAEVKGQEYEKKYASYARKLPSMIVHNGLLSTCAFVRSKANKEEAWKKVEEHLLKYLKEYEKQEVQSLVSFLSSLDLSGYRLYTKKLLYFANWLKRIAEGELKQDEE
ncbi:MAG: type III-B CRISPR module-associated protein Cmr5 [Aquificaceae bacterium]|nr:type III-B CRISPR module-associated protein Cmr5 [Aquificaceae bacterium]MDW8424001.1 type III-B CRISPR module-associated protein Cmr5 [Aquificaceae bacterium]